MSDALGARTVAQCGRTRVVVLAIAGAAALSAEIVEPTRRRMRGDVWVAGRQVGVADAVDMLVVRCGAPSLRKIESLSRIGEIGAPLHQQLADAALRAARAAQSERGPSIRIRRIDDLKWGRGRQVGGHIGG